MDLLNYILNEVKHKRIGKSEAVGLIRQYRTRFSAEAASTAHPLVQRNTSDLSEQRFSARLTGNEFFLADHVVQGKRVLPGVAYLEMAREALVQAGGAAAGERVRLKDVVWMRPVVADQAVEVHIGLYPDQDGAVRFAVYSGEDLVHSQGTAEALPPAERARLDLAPLRARCTLRTLDGAECYRRFAALGLDYGPAHQVIEAIHVGKDEALARLHMPAQVAATLGDYVLHPSLLDAALQAVAGMVGDGAFQLALPFAVEEVEVAGPCRARMWAWVRPGAGDAQERVRKYDIVLCDDDGEVCVTVKRFAARAPEAAPADVARDDADACLTLLAPAWDPTPPLLQPYTPIGKVLVAGASPALVRQLHAILGGAHIAVLEPGGGIPALAAALGSHGEIGHLVWFAPDGRAEAPADDGMIAAQQDGVLQCFRLVKALLEAGHGGKALDFTVVTTQTQAVHAHERVHPAHAGVHGLVGTLAKEYPEWKLRLVDLPQDGAWPLGEALRLAPDAQGNGWAWRNGRWYRQTLLPAQVDRSAQPCYRRGGVYVVIGGAGGIGEAWSEHVIRHHGAQVVWIGRRALDAAIQTRIDRLAAFGPAPLYLSADAGDRVALGQACLQVKARFNAIHGVIHSAIVLRDQSLANMDEARMLASLSAKVDVSVRLAQVFRDEALDFVLFFSSLQSFSRAAGQGNYAAGCTFTDAFAQRLGRDLACPVKVMNWGWWGSVGVVASDAYRARMTQLGLDSIEPEEGMAALATLLDGPARQLALLKTTRQARGQAAHAGETVRVFAPDYAPMLAAIAYAGSAAVLAHAEHDASAEAEFEAQLGWLLCAQLQVLGLQPDQEGTAAGMAASLGLRELYGRWFDQSLRLLAGHGHLHYDGQVVSTRGMPAIDAATAWAEWERRKLAWLDKPAVRAQVVLVETTLRALPDILAGRVPATDVMFPGSSMRLVEGIYKHNPVADYFNEVLAEVAVAFVAQRLAQAPRARVRILEIGAGTGGTSALLFERLRPYADRIDEYCYTDLSKAFLFHAEKEYGPANPYLRYRLFDVGRALAPQEIEAGSYDLVVATNVLHATPNIRRSVRNAKAALRANGLLLLNEISRCHPFTHLTFGLLEGWWLYEDPELRIPGCPGLTEQGWRTVLEDEGFGRIVWPAAAKLALGQQIVVAESDGVVRQAVPAAPADPGDTPADKQADQQAAAPAGELHEKTVAYLKGLVSRTLKLAPGRISAGETLDKYGIDSILVVELTTALQSAFDNVTSTLFFEYRTLDELAAHFIATQPHALARALKLAPAGDATARRPAAAAPEPQQAGPAARRQGRRFAVPRPTAAIPAPSAPAAAMDVAVIGLSGRYARAANLDEFWDNLKQGINCITEIPAERWNHDAYFDPRKGQAGKTYSKWGGFIDGVDRFDPLFFNIAPREAAHMDPQERLFLMEAYAGIEDAGYTPAVLAPDGKVGVFVGVMNSNYGTGTRYWSIANRVSYLFNFHGPSMAVDTACSASLTAIHLAVESLRAGSCKVAIAGGVNLIVDPVHYLGLSAVNMLSAGDRCRSFGDQADGFVDGEAVGVVLLKPLHQAVADGDRILGVIKGTAINHGGRTGGYTVPNPQAQAAVIARALESADIDARTVSYIEAHGTGTALGDPIEIAGLSRAFAAHTQARQFCAVGSVKSNIGHCESAAGIAGVTKVLLQMHHGELVPSLHADTPNPHIDFGATPFAIQRTPAEWARPVLDIGGRQVEVPRRAGVSSFGAGGSNAHVVIEEYVAPANPAPAASRSDGDQALLVLSARTEECLRQRAQDLLAAIARRGWGDERLADLAYTLQVGREAMEERLALAVDSMAALRERLSAWLAGEDSDASLYRGQVKGNKDTISVFAADEELQEAIFKWVERKKFSKVLDLWVKGLAFDWNMLYGEHKPRRLGLPSYPFARERYWFDGRDMQPAPVPAPAPPAAALHAPAGEQLTLLAPVWRPAQVPAPVGTLPGKGMLVVGGTAVQQELLRRQCHLAQLADFAPQSTIAEMASALAACDEFDRLVWIAPHAALPDVADERTIAAQQEGVLHGFRLIKALLEAGYGHRPLEWSVFTTQAQRVLPDETVAPAHAAIHGLLGSLAKEYPNWKVRLIDYPASAEWSMAEALTVPIDSSGNGWGWRGGQWYRQQWLPVAAEAPAAVPYRRGGVYVVLGGAGGIGQAWTEHLIREHGAQVIWLGRRPLDAEIQARIDRLGRLGPAPHYIAADASVRAALQAACDEIRQRFGTIHGIVHSALVLADRSLANMDEAEFASSLGAKVDTSVRLAQVFGGTQGEHLDFVLFFSSLQSLARGAGQSNYAAGCLFMDTFAQRLGQLWPCPVKVINWGWWGSVGIAAAPAYQARMQQAGLASIEPDEGWRALAQLLLGSHHQLGLLKTRAQSGAGAVPVPAPAKAPGVGSNAALGDEQLRQLGVAKLKELVGGLLHLQAHQIDASESLAAYGIDSISVNQLCGLLGEAFADVDNTVFFDHQTIDDLAAHFLATQRAAMAAWLGAGTGAHPEPVGAVAAVPAVPDVPAAPEPARLAPPPGQADGIAIVGMACRYPGADSVEAYWQTIVDGRSADDRGPVRRWPERYAENGAGAPEVRAAFLDDIDGFDPGFFGIPLLHAQSIDPQERLFLMSCWHALENAGYGNDKWLAERSRCGEDVGVFVGVTAASYNLVGFEQSLAGNPQVTGLSFASIANRVSHALGLTGPSLSVDAMCSSSLAAVHTACESLRRNECSMAIAGGVNLNLHPSRLEAMLQGKLISEDGAQRSFVGGGRGFLAGEGVGAVVLKPLAAAVHDGDTIHAVITGSASGHIGNTLNYFTPSARGQGRVIAKALASAGIVPDQVDYVEMQATGDEGTDAAEFEAVRNSYRIAERHSQPLRLGSVKPNIGHAEAAAGMAQLIKVVLQHKHRMFGPTLLGGPVNPRLDFAEGNAVIQRDAERFAAAEDGSATRRAAINAFGAGGTAVHLVVEAAPTPGPGYVQAGPQLLVLSARSRESLRRSAAALQQHLASSASALADVAYTLQAGRRAFGHRLALVVVSFEDAVAQLGAWLALPQADRATEAGPAAVDGTAIQALAAAGDLHGLARAWVAGAAIDWAQALRRQGRRVPLPGYAFDVRPCSLDTAAPRQAGIASPVVRMAATPPAAAPGPDVGKTVERPTLADSIATAEDASTYISQQIAAIADNLHLATVGILYGVLSDKGVSFRETRCDDGSLGLYPQPPGDAAAAARLLEQLTTNTAGIGPGGLDADAGPLGRLAGRTLALAGRLLERLPGGGARAADRMLKLLPGAEGLPAAYLLKRLATSPFMVTDETGGRLALPRTIRSRKQLDETRSQYEMTVRAMPEYQSYCELIAAMLSSILDGQRPGPEQMQAASALMVDMLTFPSKLAFLHRVVANLCFADRFADGDTISVLAVGAGGFEYLSAIVSLAPPGVRIEYRVVAGWPQVATGIAELGRERFPRVSFVSYVPMMPGALAEQLGARHYDVVIVNRQDPCAREAASLLEKLGAGTGASLVFVAEPVETQGLHLILDLSEMWPQAVEQPGFADLAALGEVLEHSGYQRQAVVDRMLTLYSRVPSPAAELTAGGTDEAALADIRAFLVQTFLDAAGDDAGAPEPARRLADANLPSMTWALIFAKLRQRFGDTIGPDFVAALDPDETVESLARRLCDLLHEGLPSRRMPPVPDDLATHVMQRLVDAGRTEVVLEHAATLARGEFTSSRGQIVEYFERGSGPALIFLTALAFSKSIWEDQIREFAGSHRLIFPHLPGHAGSVDTGVAFSFEHLADDLVELMDALDVDRAHVVGWCMAGNIAQLLALRHPDRLTSLALVCTTPTDARMRGITAKELEEYSVSPLLTYHMEFNNIYQHDFLGPEVTRQLALIKQSQVPVAARALLNFIDSLFRFDTRSQLRHIRVPTLVIGGSYDIAFPIDQVALLRDGIRHCRFHVLERSGHLPFLTESAAFNTALRTFLNEAALAKETIVP
jgi:polyketide synthase PksM